MNNQEFRQSFEQWAATGCSQLLDTIPKGSGICRTVGITPEKYNVGFVSVGGGSYKKEGISGNWYTSDQQFELAKTEARISGQCIYERSTFNQDSPFLNCHYLPDELNQAIYDDRDLPSGCFDKSYIIEEVASNYLDSNCYSGVYFPTRRGDGGILVFNPNQVSITPTYTGDAPPTTS